MHCWQEKPQNNYLFVVNCRQYTDYIVVVISSVNIQMCNRWLICYSNLSAVQRNQTWATYCLTN